MKKIISLTRNLGTEIEGTFVKFPLTSLLVIAASIWFSQVVVVDGQYWDPLFIKAVIVSLILWGLGSFLVESAGIKNSLIRWLALIVAGVASLSLSGAFNVAPLIPEIWLYVDNGRLDRLRISFGLILLALGLFNLWRRSALPFGTYVLKSLQNFAQVGIVTWVCSVGVALVVYIFNYLILSSSNEDPGFRALTLVMGIGLGLGFLFAVPDQKRSVASFTAVIVRWVLLPLLTIAFVIIYAYIVKIVFTSEIPSNQVYRILSGLFLLGLPVWLIIDHFAKEDLPVKIGTRLPLLFLPIMMLQAYVIWLRISVFGLTPARYLGMMLVVFELVVILLYTFRHRNIAWILPIFAGFVLVAGIIPKINMDDLSLADQYRQVSRFNSATFDTLFPAERSRIISAYDYLNGDIEGEKMLTSLDESFQLLEEARQGTFIDGEDNFIYLYSTLTDLDISGFSQASMVDARQAEQPVDFEHVKLNIDGKEAMTVDLSGLDDILLRKNAKNDHQLEQPLYMDLADGSRLYFLYINGETSDGISFKDLSFNGLLLIP
ncbi:MAG: DUF4153 domain-containing protein [Chloroflexi bacterium]|nr:DUF4153 domain-containing protein [Chloroflexota bacterium]